MGHLSNDAVAVAVDAAAWAVIQVSAGYLAHRLPITGLDHDTWLTRGRRFEDEGRFYERFGVRRWKDRLPEAGAVFAGGVSKRHVAPSDGGLRAFAVETRRAEIAHWIPLAMSPLFALWNRPLPAVLMVVYGIGFNMPFIAVQRYNRARVSRSLAARARNERRTRGNSMPNGSPP